MTYLLGSAKTADHVYFDVPARRNVYHRLAKLVIHVEHAAARVFVLVFKMHDSLAKAVADVLLYEILAIKIGGCRAALSLVML